MDWLQSRLKRTDWLLAIAAGTAVGFAGLSMLVLLRWPEGRTSSSAGGLVYPSEPGRPEHTNAERDARAALDTLRAGMRRCALEVIHTLPGTSPAIPPSLSGLKTEGYESSESDWSTPVWHCTQFRMASRQQFQIQWQLVKRSTEGVAVAWLDDDSDGSPDRAFGFRATMNGKNDLQLGEVVVLNPIPAVSSP